MNKDTVGNVLFNYRHSDKNAVICGNEKVTYRELWSDGVILADALQRSGVKKGDRVALDVGRKADYIRMMAGIALLGAIGVTLDHMAPEMQRKRIIEDSTPRLIVDRDMVRKWREDNVNSQAKNCDVSGEERFSDVQAQDPFWIIYTSGSTGTPKGSVLSHKAFVVSCASPKENKKNYCIATNCEALLIDASFSYAASIFFTMFSLCNEKTAVLTTDEEAKSISLLAKCINDNKVDYTCRPQSWIMRALENEDYADAIKRIKVIDLGGEKNTNEALVKLSEVASDALFFFSYGCSEILLVTGHQWTGGNSDLVGEPLAGNTVYVLDDSGHQVQPGMTGEICFGGISASLGYYWNAPALTEKKYEDHPEYGRIYHIGDLGLLDANGDIHILGRMDNMIKIHGVRIEPEYPENVIKKYPGIKEAVVMPFADKNRTVLKAYYTCVDSTAVINEVELRRYLSDNLPFYMIPAYYGKLDEMPINASGKLDRKKLEESVSDNMSGVESEDNDKNTPVEDTIIGIFEEVLKLHGKISKTDSFFELGGDSISALEVAYVAERKGLSIDIKWIYAAPTPALLACFLMASESAAGAECDAGLNRESVDNIDLEMLRQKAEKSLQKKINKVRLINHNVEEQLKLNNPWMRMAACHIDKDYSREEWTALMREIVSTHEMLRSVHICQDGQYLRGVLDEYIPDTFYVDISGKGTEGQAWSLAQQNYFDTVTHLLMQKRPPVFGDVLFHAGYIKLAKGRAILLLYYSHSLLDMIGVDNLIRDILSYDRESEHIKTDTVFFDRHTDRILYNDRKDARTYWENICRNAESESVCLNPETKSSAKPVRRRITGDKHTRDEVVRYCADNNIALASFLHLSVGRALGRLSGKETVTFFSACSGRDKDEIKLAGMFATLIPFRVNVRNTWMDIQEQLINSQKYSWIFDVPGEFENTAGSFKDGLRLDILDAGYHENSEKKNDPAEAGLENDLKMREFILQHKQKLLQPGEDGRPCIYVNRQWSELYVIEYETDAADADIMEKFHRELKKELCCMTGSAVKLASVLTPVHEVDMQFLERAFLSLKAQKFGFENLEWDIVLHNCSDAYKEKVHKRYDRYSNIQIVERDAPGTGLAYARMQLLDIASGKYLFFLDGDDELTPGCIKDAVSAMEKTGADMAGWMVETRSGKGNMLFACDADPAEEMLVLDKADPGFGSSLCYSGLGLWSRAFRREFIEKNDIRFDEESPAGKVCRDLVFNFEATLRADRIVILPRLTGYIYYIGIGIFTKAGNRVVYDIMDVIRLYKKEYRERGLDADNLIWIMLSLGLFPQMNDMPAKIRDDYMELLKECIEWLKKPQMNYPGMQKIADGIYSELLMLAGKRR